MSAVFRGAALIRGDALIRGRRLFQCGYPKVRYLLQGSPYLRLSTYYRKYGIDLHPFHYLQIPLVLRFQSPKYITNCKIKKFVQALYNYRYTGIKADSSDEEQKEKICFSVEEGNMNKKSTKKIGNTSSSEDKDFLVYSKKRKQVIKISDDSD